jgi:hypothetical protein
LFVHVGLGLGTLSKEGLLGTGASLIQIWVGLHTHQTQVLPSLVIVLGSLDGVELHQVVEHFLLLCCAMESHVCVGLPDRLVYLGRYELFDVLAAPLFVLLLELSHQTVNFLLSFIH